MHRLHYGRNCHGMREEGWATTASTRLRRSAIAISFSMSCAMSCRGLAPSLKSRAAQASISSISLPAPCNSRRIECRGDFHGAIAVIGSIAFLVCCAKRNRRDWHMEVPNRRQLPRYPVAASAGFLGGRLYDGGDEYSSAGPSKSCASGAACGVRISKVRP